MQKKVFIFFILLTMFLPGMRGQETSRPVTGVYSLQYGWEEVLATYLSPLKYKGSSWGVAGRWSKAMPFSPENAVMNFDLSGRLSDLLNPAHTARMIGLTGSFRWSMEWRRRFSPGWQFTLGGGPGIEGGAYYQMRNGNNPVQAIANASLNIETSISKHFIIGRLPVLISDRVALPSLGVFFSPEYGETYYEIYLGNRKGLVHAGWWGNNFRIDNELCVTLDFGRTAMTISYRLHAYTQWANNLNAEIFTNSISVGVIPGGTGMKKKESRLPEEKIYSIY